MREGVREKLRDCVRADCVARLHERGGLDENLGTVDQVLVIFYTASHAAQVALTRSILTTVMAKKFNVNKIATNIKKLRAQKEYTREELAEKAKVNYNTIIKLESGANKNPTINTLLGLSQVFEVCIDDFLK